MAGSSGERQTVLGVTRSETGRHWLRRIAADDHSAEAISEQTGCAPLTAKILAGRGATLETAEAMLKPSLRALMPDPSTFQDMDAAANILADAVLAKPQVALFGDYDVDGATSVALLARWLHHFGVPLHLHIPDRIVEGYGPNIPAIDVLADEGTELLVTLDCGATSHEALAHAKGRGLTVLVLDHHQMTGEGPAVDALVNPNRPDDVSGLGHLCAAGVTFMALVAAQRTLRETHGLSQDELADLMQLLDLVALGTVADVVPLTGLNRAFVARGLEVARSRANLGLAALADAARLDGPPTPYHLGFMIGPRINAGGRIGDASMGARLLTETDPETAQTIAAELDTLNRQRQAIEMAALEDAVLQAERSEDEGVILVRGQDWHPGVVGLIAARLKERFHRPAIAFAPNTDGGWTGSARSVPGIDIGAAVHRLVADGLALKGGGHAMAAGLTIAEDALSSAKSALNARLGGAVETALATRDLKLDAVLQAGAVNLDTLAAIEAAEPYGAGFAEPVVALPSHRVVNAKTVGKGHIRATLLDGSSGRLEAIAFRAVETPLGDALLDPASPPLHVAGCLTRDTWNGRNRPQLRLLDASRP